MKSISIGREFSIYDDSLQTHDLLPAQAYYLRFAKMRGFYLEAQDELEIKEEKIYGVHMEKIEKVLSSFNRINRNLGVILSGHKGIGKSLFAKLLSKTAVDRGYPVIIVDRFIPGIASFIEEIKQEVLILFDEFDKTFGSIKAGDGEADPQAGLLSLFDGMSNGKKMFVVTCNELRNLNDYLINRPGRFHYHFRFDFPSIEEIDEYMHDKLEEQYYGEIDKVKNFSSRVNLNYDCLRAIAFELNSGIKFEEAIKDLNIMNMRAAGYDLVLYFQNGMRMTRNNVSLDLFNKTIRECVDMYDEKRRCIANIAFTPGDCTYDLHAGTNVIDGNKIEYKVDSFYDEEEDYEIMKALKPKYMTITRVKDKDLHYTV